MSGQANPAGQAVQLVEPLALISPVNKRLQISCCRHEILWPFDTFWEYPAWSAIFITLYLDKPSRDSLAVLCAHFFIRD